MYRSLAALLVLCSSSLAQSAPPAKHFINGLWFNGDSFVKEDFYAEAGLLTHKPSSVANVQTVDLHGGFVVPPYGDAHEHNFDATYNSQAVATQYLRDGIFYAQGMTENPEGAAEVVAAHVVNARRTVDVTYAHGGITGTNGHPKEIYESLAHGFYYPNTPEQRALVIASHDRVGKAYWEVTSEADLNAAWPKILAGKPALIKIFLLDSEHFKQATAADPQLGRGLNPALVPAIVKLAHAAHLKVAAHIDTAYDFHVAVTAGVDEMGHMPGYGMTASEDPALYRLSDADIALAAARHVRIQATAGIYTDEHTPPADVKVRRAMQVDNLTRLKKAGVTVLIGSDHYSVDSLHEADYLQALGVWTNLEMLRMWSVDTQRDVFPKRPIAQLKPGCEASFLVLAANPLDDWANTHRILDRWKQGEHIVLPASAEKPAN